MKTPKHNILWISDPEQTPSGAAAGLFSQLQKEVRRAKSLGYTQAQSHIGGAGMVAHERR
jgi:hypothetical protein